MFVRILALLKWLPTLHRKLFNKRNFYPLLFCFFFKKKKRLFRGLIKINIERCFQKFSLSKKTVNQGLDSSILEFDGSKVYSEVCQFSCAWVTQPRMQRAEEVMWAVAQILFCPCLVGEAGTQLNFRGLHFHSNVPKLWFTTTSGMWGVAHSLWNSLERKTEKRTVITFNKSCLSRNPHHTWHGTSEPMLPFRCLR